MRRAWQALVDSGAAYFIVGGAVTVAAVIGIAAAFYPLVLWLMGGA